METLDDGSAERPSQGAPPDVSSWESLWAEIDAVSGWLTKEQARVLHESVLELPPASTVLEIGSHYGRSTLALATARADVRVVAVDPFIKSRLLPGASVQAGLRANLVRLGVSDVVHIMPTTSRRARRVWRDELDLLWIDGKHDVVSLLADLRWRSSLRPGAKILVHDAFSSVGVTTGLLLDQARPSAPRYLGRTGSLAAFASEPATPESRRAFARELPWWVRNVAIKVLLRLGLRSAARALFGHTDTADPY